MSVALASKSLSCAPISSGYYILPFRLRRPISSPFGLATDAAKREHIINQMNLSVTLLRECGPQEWSLPSFETEPLGDGDFQGDDSSDDDRSDGSGDGLQTPSPRASGGAGRRGEEGEEGEGGDADGAGEGDRDVQGDADTQPSLQMEIGWFVVFPLELSNPRSLKVGKIVSFDWGAEDGGEVSVHWYTPARKRKCRRSKYGKGVWSPSYVMEENRRKPDEGTESVRSVCITFPTLLQSGKLPTAVWAAVEESVPTDSLDEVETDEEEDGHEDELGEGADPAQRPETSRPPPPPTATRPPPPPAPRPPANVRLTAAHFRQRRGQPSTYRGVDETEASLVGGAAPLEPLGPDPSEGSAEASSEGSGAAHSEGVRGQSSVSGLCPPCPPEARPTPPAHVRLTAARFRQRRGRGGGQAA